MRVLIFLWMSVCLVAPASAVVRTHGTLDHCVVTIGNFCPIESVGASVVGTVVLALIIGGIGFAWRAATAASAPPRPYLDVAGRLLAASDYDGALAALEPHVASGDRDTLALLERVKAAGGDLWKKKKAGGDFLQRQEFSEALPVIEDLAYGGDPQSQYVLGLMHLHGRGTDKQPVLGIKWLALAAKRGWDAAAKARYDASEGLMAEQLAEVDEFLDKWTPQTEAQREVARKTFRDKFSPIFAPMAALSAYADLAAEYWADIRTGEKPHPLTTRGSAGALVLWNDGVVEAMGYLIKYAAPDPGAFADIQSQAETMEEILRQFGEGAPDRKDIINPRIWNLAGLRFHQDHRPAMW